MILSLTVNNRNVDFLTQNGQLKFLYVDEPAVTYKVKGVYFVENKNGLATLIKQSPHLQAELAYFLREQKRASMVIWAKIFLDLAPQVV